MFSRDTSHRSRNNGFVGHGMSLELTHVIAWQRDMPSSSSVNREPCRANQADQAVRL